MRPRPLTYKAGVFRTDLNTKILDSTGRGNEFKIRTPMGRFGKTEEAAALVAWLSSEDCSFTTGAVFDLSGGRATY